MINPPQINPDSWATFLFMCLCVVFGAWNRFEAWRANRSRNEIKDDVKQVVQQSGEIHKLVNGRSTADAEKIAYLSQRVSELTGDTSDRARALAAKTVVDDMKSADASRPAASPTPSAKPNP